MLIEDMYQAWGDGLIKNQISNTHIKSQAQQRLSSAEGQVTGVHWLASWAKSMRSGSTEDPNQKIR